LLLATGHRGVASYTYFDLSPDTLQNRLLAVGLRAIQRMESAGILTAHTALRALALAPLLEDVSWYELWRLGREGLAEAFQAALSEPRILPHCRNALGYARAIALSLGSWPRSPDALLPGSFFISLETLFEEAVRTVAESALAPVPVVKGASLGVSLLSEYRGFVADPDLVVLRPSAAPLTLDAKYKDWGGIEHPDVYQLVSHCTALASPLGALVYPGSAFDHTDLGATRSGIRIVAACVRLQHLREDVERLLTLLGEELAVTQPPAPSHGAVGSDPAALRAG
jgi:hypothetical protein